MTSQEFIAKLSPAAHEIMAVYQFRENKPLKLIITDNVEKPCYIITDQPDCYPLFINPDALGSKADAMFIHEFIHCVQIESNFPCLKAVDKEDMEAKEVAMAINSLVLDMFVNHVMSKHGYKTDEEAEQKRYTELYYRFRYFNENKTDLNSLGKKYNEYIYASLIARVYLNYDVKKARGLQKLIAPINKNVKTYSGILINVIKAYPNDSHLGCDYTFENLMEKLQLKDIVYIDYHEEERERVKKEDEEVKVYLAATKEALVKQAQEEKSAATDNSETASDAAPQEN